MSRIVHDRCATALDPWVCRDPHLPRFELRATQRIDAVEHVRDRNLRRVHISAIRSAALQETTLRCKNYAALRQTALRCDKRRCVATWRESEAV
jgi:hypothetical protein